MSRARSSDTAGGRRRPSRVGLLLLAAAAWLSLPAGAVADRLDEIRARGHLIVGVKGDYHPFGVRDEAGKLVGYDVDVAHGLAEPVGVPARLIRVTSANRLQKLARGEIDVVVATLGDNLSRRRLVTMIEPQYYGDGANVLLRTDSGILSWEDLRGRTLCSVQGSIWNRLASERLLVETISLNSTREAALALRNGHCVGWLYDEVNLLSALATGRWNGFSVTLPTRFVAPWAIAIRKEEAGGRLDRLLGDKVASWHRDGYLQELEKKWKLPPSPYLRQAREVWQRKDEAGDFACRRDEAGNWPLECRERALVTPEELGGLTAIAMSFKDATGLDVSPVYDPLNRSTFLYGLFLTVALSVSTVLGSVFFGALFGWVMHRRIVIAAPFLHAFCAVLRMTPPLLQLYVVFFGIGGILFAYGFTLDAFSLAAVVLSLYAAASNAVSFSLAADVAARDGGSLGFSLREFRRAFDLCQAAIAGNSINIVKATGMASTLALPELVHASTAIIAEKGNDGVMMNLLLLCYFGLVFATIWALRGWERKAQQS